MGRFEAVIWDVDGALVESEALRGDRDARRWRKISERFELTSTHPLLPSISHKLTAHGCPQMIVTSAPSKYARELLKYHNFPSMPIIGYHDCPQTKPHPAPLLLACERLEVPPEKCLYLGNEASDRAAAIAAEMHFMELNQDIQPTILQALEYLESIILRASR